MALIFKYCRVTECDTSSVEPKYLHNQPLKKAYMWQTDYDGCNLARVHDYLDSKTRYRNDVIMPLRFG